MLVSFENLSLYIFMCVHMQKYIGLLLLASLLPEVRGATYP